MKIDFKRAHKEQYTGKEGRFDVFTLSPIPYLMIDGDGGPVGDQYPTAIAALYALSYGLKFFSKQQLNKDYVVGPLEGLWWADDMNTFITREKHKWKWTMMIRQPDWLNADQFEEVRQQVIKKQSKKKDAATTPDVLNRTRLELLDEGQVVQVLHVGSYDDEGPILKQMHEKFMPEQGFQMTGIHHEIYLSDPRKIAPEKLKTILRQPVMVG
jgi:hypothetical protein